MYVSSNHNKIIIKSISIVVANAPILRAFDIYERIFALTFKKKEQA